MSKLRLLCSLGFWNYHTFSRDIHVSFAVYVIILSCCVKLMPKAGLRHGFWNQLMVYYHQRKLSAPIT